MKAIVTFEFDTDEKYSKAAYEEWLRFLFDDGDGNLCNLSVNEIEVDPSALQMKRIRVVDVSRT